MDTDDVVVSIDSVTGVSGVNATDVVVCYECDGVIDIAAVIVCVVGVDDCIAVDIACVLCIVGIVGIGVRIDIAVMCMCTTDVVIR